MTKPSKAKAEGALEEIKVLLRWLYNTRTFCMSLPYPKFISYTKTIQDILSKYETKANNLKTLIERLNNTSTIIPLARHLLARIRFSLKYKCLCLVPITTQYSRRSENPYEDPPEGPQRHINEPVYLT